MAVKCSGRPQMKADNLKLAPVTLGFLNTIFNFGTNVNNTIFENVFSKTRVLQQCEELCFGEIQGLTPTFNDLLGSYYSHSNKLKLGFWTKFINKVATLFSL